MLPQTCRGVGRTGRSEVLRRVSSALSSLRIRVAALARVRKSHGLATVATIILLMVALPMIGGFEPVPEAAGFHWKPAVHWLCKGQQGLTNNPDSSVSPPGRRGLPIREWGTQAARPSYHGCETVARPGQRRLASDVPQTINARAALTWREKPPQGHDRNVFALLIDQDSL